VGGDGKTEKHTKFFTQEGGNTPPAGQTFFKTQGPQLGKENQEKKKKEKNPGLAKKGIWEISNFLGKK